MFIFNKLMKVILSQVFCQVIYSLSKYAEVENREWIEVNNQRNFYICLSLDVYKKYIEY